MDKKAYNNHLDIWEDTAPFGRIAELEQQLLEANAKLERQNSALLIAIHNMSGGDAKAEVRDIYDETSAQSLRLHDADVLETLAKDFTDISGKLYVMARAKQLRNSVKEGE